MSHKSNIAIRDAERRDLPRLIELMEGLTITTSTVETDGASSLADYEKVFDQIESNPDYHLVVAEIDGRVVGSAVMVIMPNLSHRAMPWAVMENIVVDENMRRRGIAREMVNHLVDRAKRNGCYKVGLSSNKKRTEAHRFYESLGFTQYGFGYRIYF